MILRVLLARTDVLLHERVELDDWKRYPVPLGNDGGGYV